MGERKMISNLFKECLADVYHGEVTGETAFGNMLGSAESAEQSYIIGTLFQFETEGKTILRPLLARCGLSIQEDDEARAGGKAASEQMNALPWSQRFAALHDLVKANFLPRYEELAALVSAEEDPEAARIAAFMGEHERALLELSANIVAGTPDPAAPVAALLHHPLPQPG